MAARKDKEPEVPVVRASARYVRVAPRKARLVADRANRRAAGDGDHSHLAGR